MGFFSIIGLMATGAVVCWVFAKAVDKASELLESQQELRNQMSVLKLERDNIQAKLNALNSFTNDIVAKNRELTAGLREFVEFGIYSDDDEDHPEEAWTFKDWDSYLSRMDKRVRSRADAALTAARKVRSDGGVTTRFLLESILGAEGGSSPSNDH